MFESWCRHQKIEMYRPLPPTLTIHSSVIDGLGLFAKDIIKAQTVLGISHIKDERFENGWSRTPLGGFINHSEDPNCALVLDDEYFKLKTLQDIHAGEELTLCYVMYNPARKAE